MMAARGRHELLLAVPVTVCAFLLSLALFLASFQIVIDRNDVVSSDLFPLMSNIALMHFDGELLDIFNGKVCN